jgi:hypothetical protein
MTKLILEVNLVGIPILSFLKELHSKIYLVNPYSKTSIGTGTCCCCVVLAGS